MTALAELNRDLTTSTAILNLVVGLILGAGIGRIIYGLSFMGLTLLFKPVVPSGKNPASSGLSQVSEPVNVEGWLALMDRGEFAESWEAAAPYFQRSITKEEWIGRLQKVRHPLGPVLSRKLASSKFTIAGTRFEAKHETSFDGLLAAVETVTFARQSCGEWLAIGYLIQPTASFGFSVKRASWFASWLCSPLSSPEVREISEHLTNEERNEAVLYGLLWGLWVVTVTFGNFWLLRTFPAPGKWIVSGIIAVLFFASLQPWFPDATAFSVFDGVGQRWGYSPPTSNCFVHWQNRHCHDAAGLDTSIDCRANQTLHSCWKWRGAIE